MIPLNWMFVYLLGVAIVWTFYTPEDKGPVAWLVVLFWPIAIPYFSYLGYKYYFKTEEWNKVKDGS